MIKGRVNRRMSSSIATIEKGELIYYRLEHNRHVYYKIREDGEPDSRRVNSNEYTLIDDTPYKFSKLPKYKFV